jgi:hypothetical protein
MLIAVVCILLVLVFYHAWLEWVGDLAGYLCRLVRIERCPRWLPPILTVLAVGNLALPLVGALIFPRWQQLLLAYAAGGFVGDALSTHIIPSLATGQRAPALSTWWAYLLAGGGLAFYFFAPFPFIAGIISFVILWPAMLALRAVIQ